MDRRQFLLGSSAAALLAGCPAPKPRRTDPPPRRTAEASRFPLVEARGTPGEIGAALGAAARERIHKLLQRRGAWFNGLKRFALAKRRERLDPFLAPFKKLHPDLWAELQGIARGAQRPLDDLLVLNLQPELNGLRHQCGCSNCSTLQLQDGRRAFLAHNEDDHDASRDLMLVVRVRPAGKPAFVSLAYPGILPGNVPAMTSAGLVQTTNYIGAARVVPGVPRYVLGRSLLAAKGLDDAVKRARSATLAYSFHANLGCQRQRRLVSVELGPGGAADVRETKQEIYLHTNHYLRPAMQKRVPEIPVRKGGSSDSRYRVLQAALAKLPPLAQVGPDALVRLLSDHTAIRQPYAPCRHPQGAVKGRTVATALFDLGAGTFDLYEGNPCEGRRRRLVL